MHPLETLSGNKVFYKYNCFYRPNDSAYSVISILQHQNYYCILNISSKKKWTAKLYLKRTVEQKKNPRHLQKNVVLLYSPRNFTIGGATNEKTDTEVTALLPKNYTGYITSKFK